MADSGDLTGLVAPVPGSQITLLLTGDRVVAVKLLAIDLDGALVLGVSHPAALRVGKVLTVVWDRAATFTPVDARILEPRLKPHPDAGRLRLKPVRVAKTSEGPEQDGPPPTAPADGAAAARDQADAPAPRPRPLGLLRLWKGVHPTTNMALRLPSGRVRTVDVRRIDYEAGLVLELRRPSSIPDGTTIEIAWSDRYNWMTARTKVLAAKPDGDPDAGLLRLALAADPGVHENRRGSARAPLTALIRGVVERCGPNKKGTTFEADTIDLSLDGIAFASNLPFAAGDGATIRVIGDSGQIGGETRIKVLRVAPLAGTAESRIVALFVSPPGDLKKAVAAYVARHR